MAAFSEPTNALVPKTAHGTIFSLDVISTHAPLQPDNPEVIFGVHELCADAPPASMGSVVVSRSPHFLIEINPITTSAEAVDEVVAWAREFYEALKKTSPANILPAYLPLTRTEDVDLKAVYGSQYEALKAVKNQYEPDNTVRHALGQLWQKFRKPDGPRWHALKMNRLTSILRKPNISQIIFNPTLINSKKEKPRSSTWTNVNP